MVLLQGFRHLLDFAMLTLDCISGATFCRMHKETSHGIHGFDNTVRK